MHARRYARAIAGLGIFTAMSATALAGTLECRSDGHRYNYCRTDTNGSVRLVDQISRTKCKQDRNWGYDGRGIWVDSGCSARFEYGYGGGHHHGRGGDHDDSSDVIAGVAAIAILAAISHSDHAHSHHADESDSADQGADVPRWAVGTFRGGDNQVGADVSISIDRYGRISGYYGHSRLDGQFDGDRLWLGNRRYHVDQAANGMRLTARDDRNMVIFLYRD